MTRTGGTKKVDGNYANGRLVNARSFLQSARNEMEWAAPGANGNPISTLIVNAAIAYTDALTAKTKGVVNQKDHAGAAKLLRDCLGNRLSTRQENALRRILGAKDEVEYGATIGHLTRAEALLENLEAFAAWVEVEMLR